MTIRQQDLMIKVEDCGELTIMRVPHTAQMIGLDVDIVYQLWESLKSIRERRRKVLLIHVPPDNLSPATVDAFRQKAQTEKPISSFSPVDSCRPVSLARADYAVKHLMETIHTLDTFVIVAVEGQIDFDLFGLLLCCDFRICTQETTFVNRVLDVGVAPGSGSLWFLSRFLGYGKAYDLMVEEKSLSAKEANELNLVNRVIPSNLLDSESLATAEHFAGKTAAALRSLKRAADFLDHDFATYLRHIGSGFGRLPACR